MKNITKQLFLFIVLLPMVSCTDLELINPNQPTEDSFWQTENDLFQGVIAAYDQLQSGALYGLDHRALLTIMADEGTNEAPWEFNELARFTQDDLNAFGGLWGANYTLIARAYQVIERAPEIEGSMVPRINAEAQFLAALGYYNLLSGFGDRIAYVDGIQGAEDKPRRADEGELWQLTESLLESAIPNLPLFYGESEYGRITSGAAQSLLAKVHLQQGDYAAAEPLLEAVVNSGQYILLEHWEDNFSELNTVNMEAIFHVNFLHNGVEAETDNSLSFKFNSLGEWKGGYGDVQSSNVVRDAFLTELDRDGNQDVRMNGTIFWEGTDRLFYGESWADWMENSEIFNEDVNTAFYKYSEQEEVALNNNDNNALVNNGGKDFIVIRYADILLLYAEVLNELGRTNEAYPYVDQVRERANMRALSEVAPGLSKEDFLQQLKHERTVELAGEALRWFDQKRWGDYGPRAAEDIVIPAVSATIPGDSNFETFTIGQDELFAIPQSELDLNTNLLQNPGY